MLQIWWRAIGTTSPVWLSVHQCFYSIPSHFELLFIHFLFNLEDSLNLSSLLCRCLAAGITTSWPRSGAIGWEDRGNTIFCDYQPIRLQVTSDVTQVTLHEYWSMIPPSGEVDDFDTVINIQHTDEAIREVCFLYARCAAAGMKQ